MKNFKRNTTSNSLTSVQKTITNYSKIDLEYSSANLKKSQRIVQPQALYHTQDNWILIAWCALRTAYREFRLDRINQMVVLPDHFDASDFDLRVYFQDLIKQAKRHP